MSCDKHHLMWIRDRLIFKGDDPFVDFLHRLQEIIDGAEVCNKYTKCELWEVYRVK